MKILESRYYRAINILRVNGDDEIQLYDKHRFASYRNPYRILLSDILCDIYLEDDDLIIYRDQLQHFEKCSDFYTLSYASKSNRLYEDEECYYHPEFSYSYPTTYPMIMITNYSKRGFVR